METFNSAIRTTQKEGGGIYVEAKIAIEGDIYTYAQHYSAVKGSPTYADNIPEAVDRFRRFYYPMYLQDIEDTL